ncbi:K Homology domain-containing protein [Cynara cardunculus var. scolymus]|uniref:K Homology domain-containing protein n=1 Tax=Cynara cardunculus var. scolymus TaxID=59895 RepID=A0A103XM73_CYNCS|nr:K Homology domain-containing protein [Cynara cardunculus var. scolymus]
MNESPIISLPIDAAAAAASRMFEPTSNSSTTTVNGGVKRIKNRQPPLTVPAGCTCFRLLCHASRIGGVIGKSGAIIKQLQLETSAKIRVEDPPPRSDDRVITVIANSSVNKRLSFGEDDNRDVSSEYNEVSAAQEALVRVFERILLVAAEADGGHFAPGGVVSCRLLTDKSVVGSVIGKGGIVIAKIRKDTGCKIRILVDDKLPSCALPTDEMVEIEGDVLAIKKALVAVSRCLQDCPHAHKARMAIGRSHHNVPRKTIPNGHTDFPPPRTQVLQPPPTTSADHHVGGHHPLSSDGGTIPSMDSITSQQEIVFRMLISNDRVGSLIGKSGTIIQALQNESGATITVGAPVSDCAERLITITTMESPESQISPAQNAVILVFNRFMETGSQKGLDQSSTGTPFSARILISPNQIGCLLGKGGSIIADMRKSTGAVIKIVGDHQVPKCASETDQVVLMTGDFVSVRDALYSVTGRLRNNLFSSKTSNGPGTRGTYARGNNYPPSGLPSDQHTTLTQSMDSLKLSNVVDRPPTPGQWQAQISAGRSAVVTNMSVEIIVPQNVIGSVYGENGSNLTRLRQISGAKVAVQKPHSGTTDRVVVISGTPDETQSAQSLLQAFILADQ